MLHAVKVLQALAYATDLDANARSLGLWLVARGVSQDGRCQESIETTVLEMAAALGVQYAAGARVVARMVKLGWLERPERRGTRPRLYRWSRNHPALSAAWIDYGAALQEARGTPFMQGAKPIAAHLSDVRSTLQTDEGAEVYEQTISASGEVPSREIFAILVAHAAQRKRQKRAPDRNGVPAENVLVLEQWLRDLAEDLALSIDEAASVAMGEWFTMVGTRRPGELRGCLERSGHPLRLFSGKDLDVIRTTLEDRYNSRRVAVVGEATPIGVRRQMVAARPDVRAMADMAGALIGHLAQLPLPQQMAASQRGTQLPLAQARAS